ncbi:putative quinol monooxygenase [Inquilinus limosus]|uniref:Antibiotic biosynthesis monooxygenase n=1 Tax=Inquilinus limosus TaxID=171674 RepID=A0A211ZNU4_9PROT|nr:putative quinol monooxygenase [Inquilinus limosus]OWJ66945.1 antibiotic biosynthesis monooxygenase [Inquilinus limosus]
MPVSTTARPGDTAVAIIVTLHVKPGREAEFLGLLTPVLDAMRHEPGFINAVLHRSPDDPTLFMIYETWADLDELVQVQIPRAYRQAYIAALPDILRQERGIAIWQPMRGDFATAIS